MRIDRINSIRLWCMILSIFLILFTTGSMLFYRLLYDESKKMLLLQQEYRTYVDVIKRSLEKGAQEQLVDARMSPDNTTKIYGDFPEGARVSSSNVHVQHDLSHSQVNRDVAYLKESALSYYREHGFDAHACAMVYDAIDDVKRAQKTPVKSVKRGKKKTGAVPHVYEVATDRGAKKKAFLRGPLHCLNFG